MQTTELICKVMQDKDGYFFCSEIKELCGINTIFSVRSSITVVVNAGIATPRKGIRSKKGERIAYSFIKNAHEEYLLRVDRDFKEVVQEAILNFIETNGSATLSKLSNNLTHSKSAINKNLRILLEGNRIFKSDSKFIEYSLVKNDAASELRRKKIVNSALNIGMRNCA